MYVQDQKIFSVLGYFPKVSEELKNRGWVEKRDPYRPLINYSYYSKSTRTKNIFYQQSRKCADLNYLTVQLLLFFKQTWLIGSNRLL